MLCLVLTEDCVLAILRLLHQTCSPFSVLRWHRGAYFSGLHPWASLPPIAIWIWPLGAPERDERLAFTGCGSPLSLEAVPMVGVPSSPSPAHTYVKSSWLELNTDYVVHFVGI